MNVLACEGPCEVQLITDLIEEGLFIFRKEEILDRRPLHLRQPKSVVPLINTLPADEEIVFYRIGDTQTDEFDLSCFGAIRQEHIRVIKVCTKPELEILIIINEGLYREYLKVKSRISPKQFVKINVPNYTNFNKYLENHNLLSSIIEYKRIKQNEDDELYLCDLIKQIDE